MDDLERVVAGHQKAAARWAAVGVVKQSKENTDTLEQCNAKWSKIFKLFEARGEAEQDEVFAAVTMYFLANGCSPAGRYRKPIRTAGGAEALSGEVVKIVGRMEGEIRQFLRGRLHDSYMFLKHNAAVAADDDLGAAAEGAGVSRTMCWMLADWLGRDCPYFVGDEASVYNGLRTSKIAAAHEKRLTAISGVDHVLENAPESKMSSRTESGNGDHGLF